MKQKNIESRYNKLIASAESARVYDGRGEYHGYTCKDCGFVTATDFKDKGVTPFVISCPVCNGMAMHNITSHTAPTRRTGISEVKHWVRPSLNQLLKLSDGAIEHVLNGGLILEDHLQD